MWNRRPSSLLTRHIAEASALLALILTPALSWAYDFSDMCAPTTRHDTKLSTPDVLIILDTSGSMRREGNAAGDSKLSIAQDAISELATAVGKSGPCNQGVDESGCDVVRLGLGEFNNGSVVDVTPEEDSYEDIKDTVDGYNASGGTNMGQAARRLAESDELSNADQLGLGVLITDGEPNGQSTIERTVYNFCEMRKRANPIFNYAVGFGLGADPATNSLFAAAGGTGECCKGSACTFQPTELVDPCDFDGRLDGDGNPIDRKDLDNIVDGRNLDGGYKCRGNLVATTGQDLKNALLAIANDAVCTFPLDIPADYPAGEGADEDPLATRVVLDEHYTWGTAIEIPAAGDPNGPVMNDPMYKELRANGVDEDVADDYVGEGWFFATPARQSVRLTPKLCEEVKSDEVDVTETQVACLCENTGDICDEVPCKQLKDADARDDCEERESGNDITTGRCNVGEIICDFGVEKCQIQYQPMPEVCNGVDDDCDGVADNLERADPMQNSDQSDDSMATEYFEWNENETQLSDANTDTGVFCTFEDICGCNRLPGVGPAPNGTGDEWEELLEYTAMNADACGCRAGLTPNGASFDETTGDDAQGSDAPVCSISSVHSRAPGAGLLLLLGMLLGTIGLGARRAHRD